MNKLQRLEALLLLVELVHSPDNLLDNDSLDKPICRECNTDWPCTTIEVIQGDIVPR